VSVSVRDRIYQWTVDEKIFKEELQDEKATFHFRVTAPGKQDNNPDNLALNLVDISQPAVDRDKIVVSGGIAFDPKMMTGIKSVSNAEEVLFELNTALEARPEAYYIDYGENRAIKSIVIVEEIFFDGLTKDRLFRALRGVNKGLVVSIWVLRPLLEAIGGIGNITIESGQTAATPQKAPVENVPIKSPEQLVKTESAKLESGQETAKFCPQCGKPNTGSAKFCPACGHSLLKG
jgi:hypothetical protein